MKLVDLFFAYPVYSPVSFDASLDFNDEYLVEVELVPAASE